MEFVKLDYCSTDTIADVIGLISEHLDELNTSIWLSLRSRLIRGHWAGRRPFPPQIKQGRKFSVPDGIIAHLTRECGGNVHDHKVVEVTSSKPNGDRGISHGQNAANMEADSCFTSGFRVKSEAIEHTRNNWICYDFKDHRIVPTHYAIRSYNFESGRYHLKSWVVETSVDGQMWQEVDHQENNQDLNGRYRTRIFQVSAGVCRPCRMIRLVNIGRNHFGDDCLQIGAWEIFGDLLA
jgi:hypothetical protein